MGGSISYHFQILLQRIDLDAIDVGPPGYFLGPNVVTIHAADYCTTGTVYIAEQ